MKIEDLSKVYIEEHSTKGFNSSDSGLEGGKVSNKEAEKNT